eukprot:s3690_g2.t1
MVQSDVDFEAFATTVEPFAATVEPEIPWVDEFGEDLDLSGLWTPSEAVSGAGECRDDSSGYEPESACEEQQHVDTSGCADGHSDFVGVNFDACVRTALMSLPSMAPKPIWEEGVWSAIFGSGILLKSDFCDVELFKPPLAECLDSWMGQIDECRRSLKRALPKTDTENYLEVVRHVTDQSWEEERESQLQTALKRWLMVVISFNRNTLVWRQLADEQDDVAKLVVLSDLFRGKAPATLLKRARALEKLCSHFGVGAFPVSEVEFYRYFQLERSKGAPPSRFRSFLEAMSFCFHVLSMDELKDPLNSKRLQGCAVSSVPHTISQASPLSVTELERLHAVLFESNGWDAVFSGAVLFVTYSRARWADAMHSANLLVDKDTSGNTWYVEAECVTHKTMHAAVYKHRMLPLVAPALGVAAEPWADRWLKVRQEMGIKMPPKHTLMPAPSMDGTPSKRPLTASEAGDWLRVILHGSKSQLTDRKLTAHSMKSTMLSFAAKYGLSPETRLQLGYHTSGFRMVHTYSRDAAAQPLLELERMLAAVREGTFLPDCTRSGRFIEPHGEKPTEQSQGVSTVQGSSIPAAKPHESFEPGALVDLTEVKAEESDTEIEACSSSSAESEEMFPRVQGRVFNPPKPPEGYVFWQHKKLRTLHLTLPEYNRVFMCNRRIGPLHTKEGMIIRYDTPVCRNCVAAVKA